MITSSPCFHCAGGGDLVLGRELQRVDDPQHLVEVAAGRHRVDEDQLDRLVRRDHEDVAHGLVLRCGARRRVAVDVGGEHPVRLRDLEVRVADQRVVRRGALRLRDVLRPALVVLDGVDGEADDLDPALVELRLDARHVAELGRADGRERARVREEHCPRVAEPVVEVDGTFGGVRLEVRRGIAETESHVVPPVGERIAMPVIRPTA